MDEPPTKRIGLVSCLMVTRHRTAFALRAIRCFTSQDYENKELIIVDSGDDELETEVLRLGRPDILHVRVASEDQLLGDLRNLALQHARGEYFIQWDDDDWYAGERISTQLAALGNKDFCILSRWTIAWPKRGAYGISHHRLWEGSILARTECGISYRSLKRGEDTEMVERCVLSKQDAVVLLDRPDLYVYVIHGDNTFPEEHFERLIGKSSFQALSEQDSEAIRRYLES